MPFTQLSAHAKLKTGEEIVFCPATQSWWPKGGAPAGADTTEAALLDAPACYQKNVGMRTRDIQFSPLVNDGTAADTELDQPAKDY